MSSSSEDTSKLNITLLLHLRGALFSVEEVMRASRCLQDAETLALSLSDKASLARIRALLVHGLWLTGAYSAGLDLAERTASALASIFVGQIHYSRGDYRAAASVLEDVAHQTRSGEQRHGVVSNTVLRSVAARCFLAMSLSEQGAFDRADEVAGEAREISEEVRHPDTIVHSLFASGYSRGLRGDVRAATAPLERALAIIRETDLYFYAPWAKSFIGSVYVTAGLAAEAVEILAAGVQDAEAGEIRCVYARLLIGLGYAHALAGQVTQARATAEKGFREAIESGERGHEAYARHLLGLILGEEGNAAQSVQSLGAALILATELGMRPLGAHCHLGLGRLHRRTRQREPALEHLTTATTLYREMDMRFWLEQADAEMKECT